MDRRPSLVYTNNDETEGSIKKVKRLVYQISNEGTVEDKTSIIPSVVIFLNIILSPMIGIAMAIRGQYDGRLSLVGIIIRVLYFASFVVAIYFDRRYERAERYARLMPKIFGIFIIGIQLVGVIPRYDCNLNSWRTCL
jgi:hypothetical protein